MILNGLPWKWTEINLSFLRLHLSTAFWTLLLTMMATPFPLRDSYPQYELNSPIPVHFSLPIPKMSTFTLAISCLTTSNLPWFTDLTFLVPMQYCSLQHRTLLPPPVTSTTGYCFCFGSVSSFFLELFLHWSPVAYWAPTDLGSSSFSVLSFCLFILFVGFSRQEYWSGLPFPSPMDHILSELSTMTHQSWVALHGMPHSFTELDKAVTMLIRLVSFLWLWFSVCLPSDGEDKRLLEASWWERLTEGETGSCSDGRGHAQ